MKLALLATSVMLFPKAGHTMMKSEDEKPLVGQFKQAPKSAESESLVPASSSSPLPAASAASSSQQTTILGDDSMTKMEETFGRSFLSSREIMGALSSFSNEETYANALNNIRKYVFDQFVFPYTLEQRRSNSIEASTLDAITPSLQNLALTSLNIVLEEGIAALENRSEKINEMVAKILAPSTLNAIAAPGTPAYHRQNHERTEGFSKSQKNPHYISLISDLLRLQPIQIESFTKIIYANYDLIFSSSIQPPYSHPEVSTAGFLAKKSTKEIDDIIGLLKEFVPQKLRGSEMHRNILKALESLNFETFKARGQRFDQNISIPEGPYKGLELGLLSLSLMLEDEDFAAYTDFISSKPDLFMVLMRTERGERRRVINPALWGLSFEEVKERVSAINVYNSLLLNAAREGTVSNIEGEARFMAFTPTEIYKIAESQDSKNYFFEVFFQKMKDRFKEINGLPASENILKEMFPSKTSPLTDFSPELLRGKLGNYRDLFQLPPFPEFQPSGVIDNGPSSSK